MIDPALTRISNWIVLVLFPKIKVFWNEQFGSTIFDKMSTEEIQIYFIKIALYAFILICLYKTGVEWKRWIEKRSRRRKMKKHTKIKKPERTWSPTGWYWDDKKQEWIPPDYLNEESQRRWKWDPIKKIWIDLESPTSSKERFSPDGWTWNEKAGRWIPPENS